MRLVILSWLFLTTSSEFFDSSGRFLPIDKAIRATAKGTTLMTVVGKDCALLMSWSNEECDEDSREQSSAIIFPQTIAPLSDYLVFGAVGVGSDVSYLKNIAFSSFSDHLFTQGTEPQPGRLARALGGHMHWQTMSSGRRPFGVRCLILGVESDEKKPVAFELDPLGSCHRCKLSCTGPYAEALVASLRDQGDPKELGSAQLLRRCVETLQAVVKRDGQVQCKAQECRIILLNSGGLLSLSNSIVEEALSRNWSAISDWCDSMSVMGG